MSFDRARELFDASPVAILALSREGKVAGLNHAARRLLGSTPDRLVGKPILAFVEEADRDRVRELFLRALQGQQREWTTRFRRGDAAIRVQWVRAVPYRENGQVVGILVFTRDITEPREGRPDRQQLESLLENLPGQFTAVVDGQGRVRYSSGVARTHFRDDAELAGAPYETLLAGEDGRTELQGMLAAVERDGHWTGTQGHVRVDGSVFPVRSFAAPYRDPCDGRSLGMLLVGRDVSSESDWRARAAKAEHLAGVGALTSAAVDRIERELAAAAEHATAGPAARAVDRSRRILGTLGALAGVEAARERIELGQLIGEVLSAMEAAARTAGVSLRFDPPVEPIHVTGHPDGLARAVEELVVNATRSAAAAQGGEVLVEVEAGSSGTRVRVSNSMGESERMEFHRAFEPFYTTGEERLGLGLNLVRAVATAHGGRVWSEVDRDGRAVFALHLPTPDDGAGRKFRTTPLSLSRARTVLIVDDEEVVRVGVRRFLQKVGFEVREAWSGRSALAQITAGTPPEVVLTDIRMSDGAGDWLIDQLARDFPDLLRRTLIITGAPDEPEVLELGQRTGCRIVGKPLDLPALLELIDEVSTRE